MKFFRTLSALTAISGVFLAPSAWSATGEQQDSQQPAAAPIVQVAQAQPGMPASGMGMGMGNMKGMAGAPAMPGMEAQMKMMSEMHDKMLAAKPPEERNALMAEHMKIMQNGMSMMGGMGPGAMMHRPGDMAARQGMLEQRMDMMQSMMQMMMDRTQSVPATK
jgi:hypothetical protein